MRTLREAEQAVAAWMAARGVPPLPFQRATWRAFRRGDGLVHAPTGSGKTLAVWGAALVEALADRNRSGPRQPAHALGPRLLWITPLRALAADTLAALQRPLPDLGLDWTVLARTGDSGSAARRRARQGRVEVLLTTPESLSLLLSHEDAAARFGRLATVVVDEWHELLGGKRGVQLELCLARLRRLRPALRTWGLSATLADPQAALAVLQGGGARPGTVVRGAVPRPVRIDTLLPAQPTRFPWAGHLGLAQLPGVVEALRRARRSLVFTNTRAQAELWHQALAAVWPWPAATLALHHGSLDTRLRGEVEQGLREGRLRCVVATSSLDLGVDFPAVEQVIQVGSPRGAGRLLQRAGRSGHAPGLPSRVLCVPTHALELAEFAAARQALAGGEVEPRLPMPAPLDVLAQHLGTLAAGGGFAADEVLAEVRGSHAYRDLDDGDFQAVLEFLRQGGASLAAYPGYRRLAPDAAGCWRPVDAATARRHRYGIGTIASDGALAVRLRRGNRLGSIEEGFLARLPPGAAFLFAGRRLELLRIEGMTAWVRPARATGTATAAVWQGGRLPLSGLLAGRVARLLEDPDDSPEMQALAPLRALQARLSALPARGRWLAERHRSRDGRHLVLLPFAGRDLHESLALLLAGRLQRRQAGGIAFAVNDHGLILTGRALPDVDAGLLRALLDPHDLEADLAEAVGLAELVRRRFRDIARIAGLVQVARPGAEPGLRQLQASSGLLHDVLARHEPRHVLLRQARREVDADVLALPRLRALLEARRDDGVLVTSPRQLTPLAFPLWAERLRGALGHGDWQARALALAQRLEAAA